jgi:ketosteroid isomerase-like protein
MSQENVEVVRAAWKIYSERGLEPALAYFSEDCVSHDFPDMPDRATYHGRQGLRDRTAHFAEIWGDFAMEPVEFIDAGDEAVIAVITLRGRGKGSGAPLDALAVFAYELRDGEIIRDRAFTSRDAALEFLGLQR